MANQCFDQSLEPEQEPSDKNELFHWILTLAIAVIIALCVNRFVLVNAEIPSGSMENTIMTGDRVFGNRLAYIFGEPKRFDIIIFRYPDDEKQLFIKRIILSTKSNSSDQIPLKQISLNRMDFFNQKSIQFFHVFLTDSVIPAPFFFYMQYNIFRSSIKHSHLCLFF